MRTLFIHPYDPTTDFCNEIYDQYRGMDNVGIIETNNISSSALRSQIREYDRIVFIGHGCEYGLMDRSLKRLLISSSDLQFFRDKEVVCIWCNANIFAEKYNLNAFATGMFISEPSEAVHPDGPAMPSQPRREPASTTRRFAHFGSSTASR